MKCLEIRDGVTIAITNDIITIILAISIASPSKTKLKKIKQVRLGDKRERTLRSP